MSTDPCPPASGHLWDYNPNTQLGSTVTPNRNTAKMRGIPQSHSIHYPSSRSQSFKTRSQFFPWKWPEVGGPIPHRSDPAGNPRPPACRAPFACCVASAACWAMQARWWATWQVNPTRHSGRYIRIHNNPNKLAAGAQGCLNRSRKATKLEKYLMQHRKLQPFGVTCFQFPIVGPQSWRLLLRSSLLDLGGFATPCSKNPQDVVQTSLPWS